MPGCGWSAAHDAYHLIVAPSLLAPAHGDSWLELTDASLDDVATIYTWCVQPGCGAVVLFSGTVRDHAEGRAGVTHLVYEAYAEQAAPRLAELAGEIRRRWPSAGRVAILHRVGRLELTESSVVVAVSTPHRAEAFEAARFGIDSLKATLPIWKEEHHGAGVDWGSAAQNIRSVHEGR
jgi:molybdopterin synthase catalytic subunit